MLGFLHLRLKAISTSVRDATRFRLHGMFMALRSFIPYLTVDDADLKDRIIYDVFSESMAVSQSLLGWANENVDSRGHFMFSDAGEFSEEATLSEEQSLAVNIWKLAREASLLVSDLAEHCRIKSPMLFAEKDFRHVGNVFLTMLFTTKHNGAVDKAQAGFYELCRSLTGFQFSGAFVTSGVAIVSEWLSLVIDRIIDPTASVLRRSSGLPFALLAILKAEPMFHALSTDSFVARAVRALFTILRDNASSVESRVHALNIMRHICLDTSVGARIEPLAAEAFVVVLEAFSSPHWPIRNSAMLSYAAMLIRFAANKSAADDLAPENRTSIIEFQQKYSTVLPFLLDKIGVAMPDSDYASALLMLLSRLAPRGDSITSTDAPHDHDSADEEAEADAEEVDAVISSVYKLLSQFLPFVQSWSCSHNALTRRRAACALVCLIPVSDVQVTLVGLMSQIHQTLAGTLVLDNNSIHGVLAQSFELLRAARYYCSQSELRDIVAALTDVLVQVIDQLAIAGPDSITLFNSGWLFEVILATFSLTPHVECSVLRPAGVSFLRNANSFYACVASDDTVERLHDPVGNARYMRNFVSLFGDCLSIVGASFWDTVDALATPAIQGAAPLEIRIAAVASIRKALSSVHRLETTPLQCKHVIEDLLLPLLRLESHYMVRDELYAILSDLLSKVSLNVSEVVFIFACHTDLIEMAPIHWRLHLLPFVEGTISSKFVDLFSHAVSYDNPEDLRLIAVQSLHVARRVFDSCPESKSILRPYLRVPLLDNNDYVRDVAAACAFAGENSRAWPVALDAVLHDISPSQMVLLCRHACLLPETALNEKLSELERVYMKDKDNEFAEAAHPLAVFCRMLLARRPEDSLCPDFDVLHSLRSLCNKFSELHGMSAWLWCDEDVVSVLLSHIALAKCAGQYDEALALLRSSKLPLALWASLKTVGIS
jgi:hypothetical protein